EEKINRKMYNNTVRYHYSAWVPRGSRIMDEDTSVKSVNMEDENYVKQ
ncbi:10549_t:CDS:1, partial [Acaulospora colombiana]